jgi:diguanylate cyclase (GGDEF)-like protein
MKPFIAFGGIPTTSSTVLHAFRLRLLKLLLICGSLSIALIWLFESAAGLISPMDRVAYPVILVIFVACGIVLIVRPSHLERMERLSFATFATYIVLHAQPLEFAGTSIYTDASLAQWFPLVYTAAFFFLETYHAVQASILIYLSVMIPNLIHILWQAPLAPSSHNTLLLVNMLCSHPVYIVTLSGIARLKTHLVQARTHADALNAAANLDYLTGVANRRAITHVLQQGLARAQDIEEGLSVILLDVDYFKQINDTFGHAVGDQVLIEMTGALRQHLRTTDTLGRWGGEEFIIVAHATGSEEAASLAERLREIISTHSNFQTGQMSISLGVATSAPDDIPESLVKRADGALYQAKQGGRNCVRVAPAWVNP